MDRFVGREKEIREILELLKRGESISLIGESRIGKTSLLNYVKTILPNEGPYIPILIQVSSDFYEALVNNINSELSKRYGREVRILAEKEKIGSTDLKQELRAILSQREDIKFVFFLDEFQRILPSPEYNEDLSAILRELRQLEGIPMITSTHKPLGNYGVNVYDFTDLSDCHLERFQREEAIELLRIPHNLAFTEEEIKIGLEAGELHPLRLQFAGSFLYESKEGGWIYHDEQGNLIDGAEEKLKGMVDSKYQEIMKRSPNSSQNSGGPEPPDFSLRIIAWLIITIPLTWVFVKYVTNDPLIAFAGAAGLGLIAANMLKIIPPEKAKDLWKRLKEWLPM